MAIQNPTEPCDFEFFDPGLLQDGDLSLHLAQTFPGDPLKGYVPAYNFEMRTKGVEHAVGRIQFRAAITERINLYRGNIGYEVDPPFRGQRYAARSVRLLLRLAIRHSINPLWITCNPDNAASRRSCELAGARLIEIVPVPKDEEMYQHGDRYKCRYRLDL